MSNAKPTNAPAASREERLAARLRENLKRRKAQARALSAGDDGAADSGDSPESGLSNSAG
ncbi:hypothetical protein SAMN05660666_01345 [Novosphingobium aromaticivorans]|uniref:hypothetical protein n=1 Tax=Novosphingobium aromaticivorans TaxID=48935 RepID=UPI000038A48B|nr:hypothetical protein [Novosphingobium aromaticivorans]SCY30015.1 hypothetical protein SAMN05660666_01345 [Novosphingobium aromaticivorans]